MLSSINVTKRDSRIVKFNSTKIRDAINKANRDVEDLSSCISEDGIEEIIDVVVKNAGENDNSISVEQIQDIIEKELVARGLYSLAKAYILYRYKHEVKRVSNTTDASILSLIRNENKELAEENSNKNTMLASTQRDYIAGEVSRDISQRMLLPERITKAHKEGILHFHDLDYFIQPIFNCCLINIQDILDNGTVMNDKMIESPKSFQVACTVMTQVIAAVASNQYGGQSVSIKHLGKYLRKSRDKFYKEFSVLFDVNNPEDKKKLDEIVNIRLKDELKAGVQTIQYQINTLMTTNGQAPFVTLFLHLDPNDEYVEEVAMIIEEILRQRIEGIKNANGKYVTPAFPKLIYVLDEHNCLEGGRYDYLTEIAVDCTIKRMYPDYISAKIMREQHDGQVFGIMGCTLGSSVIDYKTPGNVRHVESFERAWNKFAKTNIIYYQPNGKDMFIDTPDTYIWDCEQGYVKMLRIIRNTQDTWYKIKFNNGRCVEVTDNHPFEIIDKGVVLAKDLEIGDSLFIDTKRSRITNKSGRKNCKLNNIMWLYGLLLCDSAYVNGCMISLGPDEQDIIDKSIDIMEKVHKYETNLVYQERGEKGNYYDIRVRMSRKLCNDLKNMFEGERKLDRHIPQYIFNSATYEMKMSFLAGMIDADGYINNYKGLHATIGSTNRELAMQQMLLAMDLGYDAKIYINHYNKNHPEKIRYSVSFKCDEYIIKLLVSEKKREKYYKAIENGYTPNLDAPVENDVATVTEIECYNEEKYSYDVETSSEHFTFDGIYSHNCRSCLSLWKDENGKYKFDGRFNQGVVSINLPQIGILANKDEDKFWKLFDERLELCFDALMCRHKALEGTTSDISPIHWQYGAIARLKKGEKIDKLLHDGYSTISLGYIGLYEVTKLMKGVSHTDPVGKEFALRVMNHLREATERWKKETGLGFGLYGTPAESLCYRFAEIDRKKFGDIKDITDKGYYTNSYHVDVREQIDAFTKLKFEAEFQTISSGGAVSYIEVPNMSHNREAVKTVINFMYHNIKYAEFNTKCDFCHECGYDGEMQLDDNNEWYCPQCGNRDRKMLTVTRRTCGLNLG